MPAIHMDTTHPTSQGLEPADAKCERDSTKPQDAKPQDAKRERDSAKPQEWWKLIEQYCVDHGPMVQRSARRLTGNDYDAEDVAQTVFLRLLHRQPFEGIRENPGGYLRRAAMRESISLLRSRKRRQAGRIPKPKDAGPEFIDNTTRPDRKHEANARLEEALDQLDPATVEMLVMHFRDGLSDTEIAKEFNMKRGTVSSILTRNRAKLEKIL
jgi:RNA polymerase sigma factor (sigma-70 family)